MSANVAQGSRSQVLGLLRGPVLTQFLQMRHVSIPSNATHETLVSLADENASCSIAPVPSTSPSVFSMLTLGHLNFYLREKRQEPVNTNALWTFVAPPKLGRTKVEALRQFAIEEVYQNQIAGNLKELEKFDEDIAETWKHEVKLISEDKSSFFGPQLADDDIDVLYEDLGLQRDRTVDKQQSLKELTKVLNLLRTGQW